LVLDALTDVDNAGTANRGWLFAWSRPLFDAESTASAAV